MKLITSVSKQSDDSIRDSLTSSKPEIRFAAAVVVGDKMLPYATDLIELINDPDHLVVQAARRSLVVLSYHIDAVKKSKYKGFTPKAVDYGPPPGAGKATKTASSKNWKTFMNKNETVLANLKTVPDTSSKSSSTSSKN